MGLVQPGLIALVKVKYPLHILQHQAILQVIEPANTIEVQAGPVHDVLGQSLFSKKAGIGRMPGRIIDEMYSRITNLHVLPRTQGAFYIVGSRVIPGRLFTKQTGVRLLPVKINSRMGIGAKCNMLAIGFDVLTDTIEQIPGRFLFKLPVLPEHWICIILLHRKIESAGPLPKS